MLQYYFKQKNLFKMTAYSVETIFWIICFSVVSHALPVIRRNDSMVYLKYFGDIKETVAPDTLVNRDQEMSAAIKNLQLSAGLNETGGKWHKKELTYHISKYPSRIKDKTRVENVIARAFQIWSNVTTIKFVGNWTKGPADIDIRFEAGDHGDGYPFDGPEGDLGHTFSPQKGGSICFDDEENWIINGKSGKNLFQVALHEFGHVLGLGHSEEKQAVMSQYYQEHEFLKLHADDVASVRSLYGNFSQPPGNDDIKHLILSDDDNVKVPPLFISDGNIEDRGPQAYRSPPDLCTNAAIDAITRAANGLTYVFKGDYYWKLLPGGDGIADGYPKRICEHWDGLPGSLDAAVTFPDGKTYFFKGSLCWRFINRKMDGCCYPKDIASEFEGIPNDLDAAFVWGVNNSTYFIKGNYYWRYDVNSDPPVTSEGPLTAWSSSLAGGIDAALKWNNGHLYLFKDQQYYCYNDNTYEVYPGYPALTTTNWFGCQ